MGRRPGVGPSGGAAEPAARRSGWAHTTRRHDRTRCRAALLLVLVSVVGGLVLGGCSTEDDDDVSEVELSPATSEAAGATVDATARFTVTYGDETASFDYGQSSAVPSTLSGPETNPVQLHAGPVESPLREWVLTGRLERGQEVVTSEAVVLALNVEVGRNSITLSSTDGGCLVQVQDMVPGERINGSFRCDTTYGEEPLRAEGSFAAS